VATEKKPKGKASNKGKKERVSRVDEAGKESASKKARSMKAPTKEPAKTTVKPLKAAKEEACKRETNKKQPKCNPTKKRKIAGSEAAAGSGADAGMVQARDPFEVAKQKMKGSVPAIVEAMVELAKQGSCSHAKTLLEMTGVKHMFDSEVQLADSGEPWAKLVLERLDEAESEVERESAKLQEDSPEVAAAL